MNAACAYFTQDEVVIHNSQTDMWVIVNGRVLDLTNFIMKRLETMNDVSLFSCDGLESLNFVQLKSLRLLIQLAGKDLSSYFDDKGEPLKRINQHGNSIPVFPPALEKDHGGSDFWWHDPKCFIGKVTCMDRRIRIINTLTRKTIAMTVCEEDTIRVIRRKYAKAFNSNAADYIFRKSTTRSDTVGRLFMDKTLTQNGIIFQLNKKLGLPAAIWLFYVQN